MDNPQNISLISSPPPIALLEDGIRFTIQSDRDFSGSKSELVVNFSQTQANYLDKHFTLSFMGMLVSFVFKSSPDQSGEQLTSWHIESTFEQFLTQLVDELNANYYINKYYIVSLVSFTPNGRIKFQARLPGISTNIYTYESTIEQYYDFSILPGGDPSIPPDYLIYIAPHKFDTDQFLNDPLGKDLAAVNNINQVNPNLAQYLDSQIITQFTYPFNGIYARILDSAVLKYFIKYAEFENNKTQILRSTYSNPGYVIRGGLNSVDSELLNGDGFNYFDYEDNITKFLNHAPTTKITYPGVPEILYFLISTSGIISVKLKLIHLDSSETISTIHTIDPNIYKIAELSVGISDLMNDLPVDNISSYQIWLEDDKGISVSEIRTFTIDHQEYLNKRVLFFQNSFDLYETICCTGDLTVNDSFVREEVEISKGLFFKKKISQVEHDQNYTLSSGWLPGKEYRLWLTEVLLSKDTFYMLGHILLPVLMTNTKTLLSKDRENIYSIDFSFKPDFTESRFSSIVGEELLFLLDENGTVLLNENDIGLIAIT